MTEIIDAMDKTCAEELLDWMLARMDDLVASYPNITIRSLVESVHVCAMHEKKELVDRFNSND